MQLATSTAHSPADQALQVHASSECWAVAVELSLLPISIMNSDHFLRPFSVIVTWVVFLMSNTAISPTRGDPVADAVASVQHEVSHVMPACSHALPAGQHTPLTCAQQPSDLASDESGVAEARPTMATTMRTVVRSTVILWKGALG